MYKWDSIKGICFCSNNFLVYKLFFRCQQDWCRHIFNVVWTLSLGRVWDIKSFLNKRLPRITAPFLFWGFLIGVSTFLIVIFAPNILGSRITEISSISLNGFLTYLYGIYMSLNKNCSQYWFFWMILGTYLIMPVLNKWLLHSDLKEAEYFLVFWVNNLHLFIYS